MKLKSPWMVKPHTKIRLSDCTSHAKHDLTAEAAAKELTEHRERLYKLQEILYAGQQHSVLIVLQGMDTAGKDGTISHIFSGINPQGCDIASFKTPTSWEARHDFLWRCHIQTPARGMITVFNRSHYEDVLFPRVHKLMTPSQARRHMEEINDWERMLVDNGTVILKFFLHICKEEQTRRLQSRIDDPKKHWKFSAGDLAERKFWDEYQQAYQDVFTHTSKKDAPWFIIPADNKGFRNLAISGIIADSLSTLKLKFPKPTMDVAAVKL
jgi:PPK2 family polyphosphate:nucleotide phosphotransferase